jgi:hypothetical protein
MIYRGFPARRYHAVPHWVEPGALFHIRLTVDREKLRTGLCARAEDWPWWIERSALDDESAGEAGK